MCLYVCPSGATDTENGIIDVEKCIPECMECITSCPSGAISMLPDKYPPQQSKTEAVIAAQRALGLSKVCQGRIADEAAVSSDSTVTKQFARAVAKSNYLMAEDILRESGYLLPQSNEVRSLLEALLENATPDFPKDAVNLLLNQLQKTT